MSKADGSVVIEVVADDKKAEAQLDNLQKKATEAGEAINKATSPKKMYFNTSLDVVDRQLQDLGDKEAKLTKQISEYLQNGYSDADKELVELNAELDNVLYEAERLSKIRLQGGTKSLTGSQMASTWEEAEAAQSTAEATKEIADNTAKAAKNTGKMAEGVKKAHKNADKFAARLKSVVRGALVFTVITQALSGFRNWLGDVIKATPEASAAVAKLKGALLTMVQPLVNVIIPAFTTLVNVLTAVVGKLASLFAFLSGTTAQSSADAAKALNEQTEALDGTGKAAKKAGQSLASFDEINTLSSNESSGGSAGEIMPDFSFNDEVDELLRRIADDVLLIAAGFALWKVADKLPANLSGIASSVGLIAIAVGGLIALYLGLKDAWENGVDWGNLALMIGGTALAAWALYTAFGGIAAGIALVVAGVAMVITAFKDIVDNGANLQNTLLMIAGIVAAGLGFFFLTGSVVPLVLAAIASVVVAVLGLTGNLEAFMKNLKENILGGLIEFITGVFTSDWERAWNGVKKVFYGIFCGVVMIFESAINLIIKGLNWVIGKMNRLLKESFISKGLELVGVNFTGIPDIPKVNLVSQIPALAQGAVIPPNREFLAVLGDQKSGTNIEAPLPTMVQAFRQALVESGYNGQSEAYLMLDDIQLGKVIYRLNKSESNRIGISLLGG